MDSPGHHCQQIKMKPGNADGKKGAKAICRKVSLPVFWLAKQENIKN